MWGKKSHCYHFVNLSFFLLLLFKRCIRKSSLTQVWQHVRILWSHFFFCRNSSFCCVQERFKLKQSVLFWRTKTRSLADGIPPALQSTPAFFCVCVHMVWLGFFQRSKNRINQNQNQPFQTDPVFCTGSFPVRPVIGGLKSGAVVNQTKPNTSGCELEKTFFVWPSGLYQEILQVWCFHVCVTASMPSETESVNTDNHTGADDKSSCCGPLWWVLRSLFFKVFKNSENVNILYLKSFNILFPQSKNN